jgi:DNA repair exonuclease SbcCD ATPase subunit
MIKTILGHLQSGVEKLESGHLSPEDMELLVEDAKELYERMVILRYKIYETSVLGVKEAVISASIRHTEIETPIDLFGSIDEPTSEPEFEVTFASGQSDELNEVKIIEEEIKTSKADTGNLDEEKTKLKQLAKDALDKINAKTSLQEHRNLEEVASILLKDTGIKTAIIREYLPVMNKLINKYLNAMDAYIHFELDEAFNESVKSRFRDDFTYASFSEGEKMRIDLAILFTWRQIAKMKNSVNTNLLLLDEIFDSSLDTAGTDYFLNLMNSFGDNSNIFVISHKGDQLFDKFRSVIKFEKRNDFSIIVTN